MKVLIIICSNPPNWFAYASGFASFVALLFVIMYFIRPRLKITDESDYASKKIRIKCVNKNLLRFPIIDIQCDIVASKDDSFNTTDTLELYKDWISGIHYHDNYVFKSKNIPTNFNDKKFIKVRILTLNILGIKKFYQKVFKIEK